MFSKQITAKKAKTELRKLKKSVSEILRMITSTYADQAGNTELSVVRVYLNTRLERLNNSIRFVDYALHEKEVIGENAYYNQMMHSAKVEYEQYLKETENKRAIQYLEKYLANIAHQVL